MFSYFLKYISSLWTPPVLPRILVKVKPSTDELSLSSNEPFTTTLHAVVDGDTPLTIAYHDTVLHPRGGAIGSALDSEGLTFECTRTGQLAQRPTLNICDFSNAAMRSSNDVN